MKKCFFLFVFIHFGSFYIYSQGPPIQWQKCFGGTGADFGCEICQTFDGGYIVTGYTASTDGDVTGHHNGTNMNDVWVIKMNSVGTLEWESCLGGSMGDLSISLVQSSDSGYVIAAWSQSSNGNLSLHYGSSDFWIIKLDGLGGIVWQSVLGGGDFEAPRSIQQTTDGGYILAGSSKSGNWDVTGHFGSYLYDDFWIVKINSTGSIIWQKSFGGSFFDFAESVQQTFDGGYIIAGESNSADGDITGHHLSFDYWILKIDSLGNKQWQKSLGGSGFDHACSIRQTTDGGYIVAGFSQSNDGDVTIHYGLSDYWIARLDSSGTIIWQKTFGGTGNDEAYNIRETFDRGFIISGSSPFFSTNHGNLDYYILKIDSVGTLEWQKFLGGTNADEAYSIKQTADSGYIISGYSLSNDGDVSGNHGNQDYWIVKLGSTVGTLPIELINFTANFNSEQTVDVLWSTASEINNDFFTVERSSDAEHFEKLTTIHGAGNSNAVLNYSYADKHPLNGISYYRLKQTDYDGSSTYSEIVAVKNISLNFLVFPNPNDGNKFFVSFSGIKNENILITLYDSKGQLVFSKYFYAENNDPYFEIIPSEKLPPGVYTIFITTDDEIKTEKLVVK